MNKTFKATVVRNCIVRAGTPVELIADVNNAIGHYFVAKANGKSTSPFSIFVREGDFKREVA